MVEGIWSQDEFARMAKAQGAHQGGFTGLETALAEVHRAGPLEERSRCVKALATAAARWLELRERLDQRLASTATRRKGVLLVRQLQQQAETALKALSQAQFEQAADRLATERRTAQVAPGTVSGWQGEGPGYANIFFFEQALRKAPDSPTLQQVLRRLTAGQFSCLGQEKICKVLEGKLTPGDAAWFALFVTEGMLVPPDGSTNPLLRCFRPSKVRQEVIRCISPMLLDKGIVLGLLRKSARIVAVPRNRAMTDLPMFAHLKDVIVRGGGRVWNDTRGVGDVSHAGTTYLACCEENLLGHNLDSGIKNFYIERTAACPADHVLDHGSPKAYYTVKANTVSPQPYDEGYSTTVHEFAHMIHRNAMRQADKDLIDRHYKHWSRGMTEEDLAERQFTLPVLGAAEQRARGHLHGEIAGHRISSLLRRGQLSQDEKEELAELMVRHVYAKPVPKQVLTMGWEWVDGPIGLTQAEKDRRQKQNQRDNAFRGKIPAVKRQTQATVFGKTVTVTETESVDLPRYMQSLPVAGSPCCYASSNAEEYFAQITCCWFEANGGDDSYTHRPRKNSKDWIRQNEPRPIVELLERLYGDTTLPGTNPRSAPL
jgi:hypothetical protein